MNKTGFYTGIVELTVAMLVSGTVGVFFKESHQAVFNVIFYRCIFGAIFLSLFCYFKGYFQQQNFNLRVLTLTLVSGISLILNWALIFKSFSLTSIALGTIIYHTQPFFVIILGSLILKTTISKNKIGWIAIAFLGLVLVTKLRLTMVLIDSSYIFGILFALLAAIFYALTTILVKCLEGVRPHLIVLIHLILGIFLLLPFASVEKVPLFGNHWYYLLGLGVIHTGIVYILMYSSYQKLATPAIAVLTFANPASAMLSDYLVYKHILEPIQGVGVALIIFASLAVNLNWSLFPTKLISRM
ncbi:DMT family transporter [Nostoc sp. 2RC]|uniref:DMT family transporter n=1 Tax=Nostoc sp. 2RC TaxID=2485484 RepID=UPI0016268468|nr:DMT family transporter [Nostoc sp. 2RC]MBC1241049.1 DMT family transporter [Nostoc sp. 2RC]